MVLIGPTTENILGFLLFHINTNEKLSCHINVRENQERFHSPYDAYFNAVFSMHSSYIAGLPHSLIGCFGDKLAPHSGNTVFTGLPLPTSSGAYMPVTGKA